MIHDSHIILVAKPSDIDRLLDDRMAVWITTFSAIFNVLLAETDQCLASSTADYYECDEQDIQNSYLSATFERVWCYG